jgi:hypothetical protein
MSLRKHNQTSGTRPIAGPRSQSASSITNNNEESVACFKCYDCDKKFLESEMDSIECDCCDNWFCLHCSKLNEKLFQDIGDNSDMIMWFCFHCRTALPGIKGVYKSVKNLEGKHTILENRQDKFEDRLTKLEDLERFVCLFV